MLFVCWCVLLFVRCDLLVHSLVVVWCSFLVVVCLLMLRAGVGVVVRCYGLLLIFCY